MTEPIIINEDLFKITQLDYTDSYGKYELSKISGKAAYDKYISDKKNQVKIQRSSNGNSANKYKLDSIILNPDTQIILLSSDSILNFTNRKLLTERLKMNNSYIIHAIEYKYAEYRIRSDGIALTPLEQKEILFIDNYCNYHIIRNDISTEDQNGNVINNDKYTLINTEELKHFKLPDQMIDIIKKVNGCQILGFNYNFNNIYTLLDGIGNYIKSYYNIQNQKIEIHDNTTTELSTKLEVTNQTVLDLSTTINTHEETINNLTNIISDNKTLINNLQDTINKLQLENNNIQTQSDKYKEEIRQYKFNNILYIEKIED